MEEEGMAIEWVLKLQNNNKSKLNNEVLMNISFIIINYSIIYMLIIRNYLLKMPNILMNWLLNDLYRTMS